MAIGIEPIAPKVKSVIDPKEFRDPDKWQRMLSVTGICTQHDLYVDEAVERLVYVVEPTSGSYDGLNRWWTTDHEFDTWIVADKHGEKQALVQFGAQIYVHTRAMEEVAREYDLI